MWCKPAGATLFGALVLLTTAPSPHGASGPQGAAPEDAVQFDEEERQAILTLSPLPPPPPDPTNAVADDPRAVRLGQSLFFDPRVSDDGRVSCATCHDPARGFADDRRLAQGMGTAGRHTPTVLNTAYNRWHFWDGRADSAWAQAVQPMESPVEHGFDRMRLARLIYNDPALRRTYESLFGPMPELDDTARFPPRARPVADDPEHSDDQAWRAMRPDDREAVDRILANFGKAVAAYERRLVSADAPFDRFAAGLREGDPAKQRVLSPAEKRGLKLFVGRAECIQCHSGPNFTDGEFHNLGLLQDADADPDRGRAAGIPRLRSDPLNALGAHSDAPDGNHTRKLRFLADPGPEQEGQFKTPTLRNVAQTPPYMHDGRFATLEEVMRFYSTLEEPSADAGSTRPVGEREATLRRLDLSEREIADLVAFMGSLTGKPLDPSLTTRPAHP